MSEQKILFVCNDADYFAAHRLHLAKRLSREGWQIILLSGGDETKQFGELAALRYLHQPMARHHLSLASDFRFARKIAELIRTERPDVVHSFTIKPNLLTGLTLAFDRHARACRPKVGTGFGKNDTHKQSDSAAKRIQCLVTSARSAKLRSVLTFPGLGRVFSEDGPIAIMRRIVVVQVLKILFWRSKAIATFENPDDREQFVANGIIDAKRAINVEGAGIDSRQYSTEKDRPGAVRFLFASRFLRTKGIETYFDAAETVRKAVPDAQFAIAGWAEREQSGSYSGAEVRAMAGNKGVRFLGKVPAEEMPALLQNTDVMVLPSQREGMPVILLEAAASGCALIASDIAGCRPIVEHGRNGYLVDADDHDGFVNSCLKLAREPQLAWQMGEQSAEMMRNSAFDIKNIQNAFLSIYQLTP